MENLSVKDYTRRLFSQALGIKAARDGFNTAIKSPLFPSRRREEAIFTGVVHLGTDFFAPLLRRELLEWDRPPNPGKILSAWFVEMAEIVTVGTLLISGHPVEAVAAKLVYNLAVSAFPDVLRSIRRNTSTLLSI